MKPLRSASVATTDREGDAEGSHQDDGSASSVQHGGAHTTGGRQQGALSVLDGDVSSTSLRVTRTGGATHGDINLGQSSRCISSPILTIGSGCSDLDFEVACRQVVAC